MELAVIEVSRNVAALHRESKPCFINQWLASLHMEIWSEQEEAERLRERFSGVNRAEFARKYHVPGGAAMVYQHITGRRPISLDAAQAYANGFGCRIEEISPRLAEEARKALAISSDKRPADAIQPAGTRKVWVIGNGQGGFPDRIWGDGDYPVGASDKYAEVSTDDDHAFVVCVRGDSMVPRYMPGEYALVEPSVAPEIEDDVLVRLKTGETMLKRLLSRRAGIRLGSYGTAEVLTYAPEDITWIYHVSDRISARKVKHWIASQEYTGEERRHEQAAQPDEERRKRRLPEPKTEMEHVYGRNLEPGERAKPPAHKRKKVQ